MLIRGPPRFTLRPVPWAKARARRGTGLPIGRKQTDLRTVLRHAVESIETVHPGREIVVASEGDTTGLFDADRILQAFVNLIQNAYDAMGSEGGILRVGAAKVNLANRPGVEVRIEDTGPGIPAEYQQRIFEKFFRMPGTKGEGIGLGLYISREIVAAHGGEMGVESEPGKGSRFWFTLRVPPRA